LRAQRDDFEDWKHRIYGPGTGKSPLDMPAEILATLVEISEEINSSLDLDEVLKKTATLVKRLVDYEISG